MTANRITITLDQAEIIALSRMAKLECRNPREQVRHILRKELENRGFLTINTTHTNNSQSQNNIPQQEIDND